MPIVLPGISPSFSTSGTTPLGMPSSSGESCPSGESTTSVWVPSHLVAIWLKASARSRKTSKSVRVSQGGLIAALKEWMNGCMSVVDRSCFSYQVAAGRTMSETRVVDVLRKSVVIIRSSLPCGASSRQVIDCGRSWGSSSVAEASESTPSMWRRKNSVPLAEEPIRLVRQFSRMRGQFSGASGSSPAKRMFAFSSSETT